MKYGILSIVLCLPWQLHADSILEQLHTLKTQQIAQGEHLKKVDRRLGQLEALFGEQAVVKIGSSEGGWRQYKSNLGIYIDVKFDQPFVGGVPRVFTSLRGDNGHWEVKGVTSVYCNTNAGFRVYLRRTGFTTSYVKKNKYRIDYIAIGGEGNWVKEAPASPPCQR